jgi:hypothetical protein
MISIVLAKPTDFHAHFVRGFDHAQLVADVDRVLEGLREDAALADEIDDAAAIELTSARMARGSQLRATHDAALAVLLDGEALYSNLVARVVATSSVAYAGTLDGEQAVREHAELIVACAAERFQRAALMPLRSAVSSPLHAILKLRRDEDGAAREVAHEESTKLATKLLARHNASEASGMAERFGAEATPRRAVWWPLAEARAMAAFRPIAEAAAKAYNRGRTWSDPDGGQRRDEPPTVAHLEECFARRRSEFEVARADALRRVEELQA